MGLKMFIKKVLFSVLELTAVEFVCTQRSLCTFPEPPRTSPKPPCQFYLQSPAPRTCDSRTPPPCLGSCRVPCQA